MGVWLNQNTEVTTEAHNPTPVKETIVSLSAFCSGDHWRTARFPRGVFPCHVLPVSAMWATRTGTNSMPPFLECFLLWGQTTRLGVWDGKWYNRSQYWQLTHFYQLVGCGQLAKDRTRFGSTQNFFFFSLSLSWHLTAKIKLNTEKLNIVTLTGVVHS